MSCFTSITAPETLLMIAIALLAYVAGWMGAKDEAK